ncbi:MAG: hypothetical protein V1743_03870 [Nanoarchaeota archaeon]
MGKNMDKLKKAAGTARDAAHKIRHDVETRGVGNVLKDAAEEGTGLAQQGISRTRAEINKRGGLVKIVKDLGEATASKIQSSLDAIDENFYTNGEYDPEKAKMTFKRLGDKTLSYGNQALRFGEKLSLEQYEILKSKVRESKRLNEEDYRKMYLSDEERASPTYKGIGVMPMRKYTLADRLTRPEFDAVVAHYALLDSAIPAGTAFKQRVLDDLRWTASATPEQLLKIYAENPYFTRQPDIGRRKKLVEQYAAKPAA